MTNHDVPNLETRSQSPWRNESCQRAPSDLPAREAALGYGSVVYGGMGTPCDGRGRDCKGPGIGDF